MQRVYLVKEIKQVNNVSKMCTISESSHNILEPKLEGVSLR
jgi:hypothetical protein